jgi:hypothetical protein
MPRALLTATTDFLSRSYSSPRWSGLRLPGNRPGLMHGSGQIGSPRHFCTNWPRLRTMRAIGGTVCLAGDLRYSLVRTTPLEPDEVRFINRAGARKFQSRAADVRNRQIAMVLKIGPESTGRKPAPGTELKILELHGCPHAVCPRCTELPVEDIVRTSRSEAAIGQGPGIFQVLHKSEDRIPLVIGLIFKAHICLG